MGLISRVFFFLIPALLGGCVSSSKPSSSLAERLNGQSYESPVAVMGIPLQAPEKSPIKILGQVLCGEGLSKRPARQATVSLKQDTKVMATTTSDQSGHFVFWAEIPKMESVSLEGSASCGKGSLPLADLKNTPIELHLETR